MYVYIYIYIYMYVCVYIYIYIYIYTYIHSGATTCLHPVSMTRFPLSRFSPGAGLLRNPLFITTCLTQVFLKSCGEYVWQLIVILDAINSA